MNSYVNANQYEAYDETIDGLSVDSSFNTTYSTVIQITVGYVKRKREYGYIL